MNPAHIHPDLAKADGATQVALVRVGEECAELAKEAGKALRFGIDNRWPSGDPTNREKMRQEFMDVADALLDAKVIDPAWLRDFAENGRWGNVTGR